MQRTIYNKGQRVHRSAPEVGSGRVGNSWGEWMGIWEYTLEEIKKNEPEWNGQGENIDIRLTVVGATD